MAKSKEEGVVRTSAATTRQITVNEQDFVSTRNAFVTHLYQLSGAVQKTLEAYTQHSEAVLGRKVPYNNEHIRRIVDACVSAQAAAIAGAADDDEGRRRKRKKREPRPEGMPKRPNTAFFRFQLEVRPAYRARNADKSPGEIENLMKDAWNAMSDAQKQPYKDAYKAERLDYDGEFSAWKQGLLGSPGKQAAQAAGVTLDDPSSDDTSDSGSSDSEEEAAAPLPPPKKAAGRPKKTKDAVGDAAAAAPQAPMIGGGGAGLESSPGKNKAKAARKPKGPAAAPVAAAADPVSAKKGRKRKSDAVQ